MSYLDKLLAETALRAEEKKDRLKREAAEKKAERDPSFRTFNRGRVLDGDTIWDEDLGREIRLTNSDTTIDTFESDPSKYYKRDPETGELTDELSPRFYQHKEAYEKIFDKRDGFFRKGVTPEQLAEYGQVQGQRLHEEIRRRQEAGEPINYRITGIDDYGRAVAVFGEGAGSGDYFDQLSRQENNAAYDSKFNTGQRLADVLSGQYLENNRGLEGRGILTASKDQAVNFGFGLVGIANEMGTVAGLGSNILMDVTGLDDTWIGRQTREGQEFWTNNSKRLERWKKNLVSDAQNRSHERAALEAQVNSELYEINKSKYLREGKSEIEASMLAGAETAGNAFRNVIQNPGRGIDMIFESLPYMVGVAGAGSVAVKKSTKNILQRLEKEYIEQGMEQNDLLVRTIAKRLDTDEALKKEIQRAASRTGLAAIAITEGVSNSAAVFDRIMAMTPEEAMQSEKYQALVLDERLSHEQALYQMARDASSQALAITAVLAGGASRLTRVDEFEALLLRPMQQGRRAVAKATEEGVERSIRQRVQGAGISLAEGSTRVLVPGAQELVEEGLQSAAGAGTEQFVMRQQDLPAGNFGDLVQQTVEGSLVGFGSGTGAATGSLGLGKIVNGFTQINTSSTPGDDVIERTQYQPISDPVSEIRQRVAQDLQDESTETLAQPLKNARTIAYSNSADYLDLVRAEAFLTEALNEGKVAPENKEDTEAALGRVRERIGEAVKVELEQAEIENREIDPLAAVFVAELGIDVEIDPETSPKASAVLSMAKAIVELTDEAADGALEVAEQFKTSEEVAFEKFADSPNAFEGRPGLTWMGKRVVELAALGRLEEARAQLENMRNFAESQRTKLSHYKNVKAAYDRGGAIAANNYSANIDNAVIYTPKIQDQINLQEAELALMDRYVNRATEVMEQSLDQINAANTEAATSSPAPQEADSPSSNAPDNAPSVEATTESDSGQGLPTQTFEENKVWRIPDGESVFDVIPDPKIGDTDQWGLNDDENPAQIGGTETWQDSFGNSVVFRVLDHIIDDDGTVVDQELEVIEINRVAETEPKPTERVTAAELRANVLEQERVRAAESNDSSEQTFTEKRGAMYRRELDYARMALASAQELLEGRRQRGADADSIARAEEGVAQMEAEVARILEQIRKNKEFQAQDRAAENAEAPVTPDVTPEAAEATAGAASETTTEATEGAIAEEGGESVPPPEIADENAPEELPEPPAFDPLGLDDGPIPDEPPLEAYDENYYPELSGESVFLNEPETELETVDEYEPTNEEVLGIAFTVSQLTDEDGSVSQSLQLEGSQQILNESESVLDWDLSPLSKFHKRGKEASPEIAREGAEAELKKARLPAAISDVLRSARTRAKSIIAVMPNFKQIFSSKRVREIIAARLNLNEDQQISLDRLAGFVESFSTAFAENTNNLRSAEDGPYNLFKNDGRYLTERLNENGLHYLMDSEGNLHPQVMSALAIAAYKYLATQGATGAQNDPQQINRFLGRPKDFPVTDKEFEQFGKGSARNIVVNTIGRDVMQILGLIFDNNLAEEAGVDNLFGQRLETSMGLSVIHTLKSMGLVQEQVVTQKEYAAAKARMPEFLREQMAMQGIESSATVMLAKDAEVGSLINMTFPAVAETPQGSVDLVAPIKRMVDAYKEMGVTFEQLFNVQSNHRPPLKEKPLAKMISRQLGSGQTRVPKKLHENLVNQSQHEYYAANDDLGFVRKLSVRDNWKKLLKHAFEVIPEDEIDNSVHVKNRASERAKYNYYVRSLKQMFETSTEFGDLPMYFLHRVTDSGRMNMDSNVINPQNNPVHRWFFRQKEWEVEVPISPTTAEETQKQELFYLTVGLGFGVDPSKASKSGSHLQDVHNIIASMEALTDENQPTVFEMMMQEEISDSEMELIFEALSMTEEGGHGLASFITLAKYKQAERNGETTFVTDLPNEIDGKVNGFTSLALQTPGSINSVISLLEPGGVFTEDAGVRNYTEYASKENSLDNYERVGFQARSNIIFLKSGESNGLLMDEDSNDSELSEGSLNVRRVKQDMRTGQVRHLAEVLNLVDLQTLTKDGDRGKIRKFAKNPLTIAGYMGGVRSIKYSLGKQAVENFYKKLVNMPNERVVDFINTAIKLSNETNDTKIYFYGETKPANQAFITEQDLIDQFGSLEKAKLEFTLPVGTETLINEAYFETYGYALEAALQTVTKEQQEFREQLTDLINSANEAFTTKFKERLDELPQPVSERTRKQVLQEMIQEGLVPLVKTPLSNSQLDALQITNDARITLSTQLKKSVAYSHQNEEGMSGALMGTTFLENVGVGALVKAIHSSDGAVMSNIVGSENVLGVHDAIVGNMFDLVRIGQKANATFYQRHKQYDVGKEFLEALERLNDDGNLDDAIEFYRPLVEANTELRNKLFGSGPESILWVNQFAFPGAEVRIENGEPVFDWNTPETAEEAGAEIGREVAETQQKAAEASGRISGLQSLTDGVKTLLGSLRRLHSNPVELLATMDSYFDSYLEAESAPLIKQLLQDIKNNLPDNLRIVLVSEIPISGRENDAGVYVQEKEVLYIKNEEHLGLPSTIVHELLHAATANKVREIRNSDPTMFDQLVEEAKQFLEATMEAEGPAAKNAADVLLELLTKGKMESFVNEFITYSMTTFRASKSTGQFSVLNAEFFDMGNTTVQRLISENKRSSEDLPPTDEGGIYGSSGDRSIHERLAVEFKDRLTADTFEGVINYLRDLDDNSANRPTGEARQLFDNLIENFILPTLSAADNLILNLGTTQDGNPTNVGMILGEGIYVEASDATESNNGQMSLEEVTLHEVVHALIKSGINKDVNIRNRVRKLFDWLANNENFTYEAFLEGEGPHTEFEIKQAKARYDYIFNQNLEAPAKGEAPAYLHEFLAMAATSPALRQALSGLKIQPEDRPIVGKDLLETIGNFVREIILIVKNLLNGEAEKRNVNLSSELESILQDITALRNAQQSRVKKAAEKLDALANQGDEKLKNLVDKILTRIGDAPLDPNETAEDASRRQRIVANLRNAGIEAARNNVEGVRAILDKIHEDTQGNRWWMEMVREVLPYPERNLSWIGLLRKSQYAIDMARKKIQEHTRNSLLKAFDPKTKLTTQIREALTHTVLRTDLQSLLREGYMTYGDILNVLNNKQERAKKIAEIENGINTLIGTRRSGKELRNWITIQTNGLAKMMIHGEGFQANQAKNAHNIAHQTTAHGLIGANVFDIESELITAIDQLTTLKALNELDEVEISRAAKVIENEMNRPVSRNGFTVLLDEAMAQVDEATETLFDNNPTQMIKGYTAEIFDDNIDIEWGPATREHIEYMRKRGYKPRTDALPKDINDKFEPVIAFTSMRGIATYNKSVISLTDLQRRGHNIYESGMAADSRNKTISAARARKMEKDVRASQKQAVYDQMKGKSVQSLLIPVLDTEGNISSHTYIMSEQNKREILKKRYSFDEVLPSMAGSIIDRPKTKEINAEAVDLLKEEWDKYGDVYEGNKLVRKATANFIEVSPTSKDKDAREMWKLLPEATKYAAEQAFGGKKLYVRKEAANLVLGFRKLSLAQGKVGDFLGPAAPLVRMAEVVWQEAIGFLRHRIAITTPQVVLGNMVSNAAVLLTEGIPADYIAKNTKVAILEMRRYQKQVKELDDLMMQLKAAKSNKRFKEAAMLQKKVDRLNVDIESNPVHELVEEGLFTSIVEDLGYDEGRLSTKLINKTLDKVTSPVPEVVTSIAKEAYMVPGSASANAALIATQLGDFVGRFIKFKYDTEVKNVDRNVAINDALAKFIYYNMPQNRYLQWMNDNGFMMFTKFFLRIQPVIIQLFAANPARATTVLVAQRAVLSGIDNVLNENVANYGFMSGATRKFNLFPWRAFERQEMLKPQFLEWLEIFGVGNG